MFSQKAKRDIDSICLLENGTSCKNLITEAIGKAVEILNLEKPADSPHPEIAFLQGLFGPEGISPPDPEHSITNYGIQQQLKWKPVQTAGVLIGAVLLVLLSVERYWLEDLLTESEDRPRSAAAQTLTEYEAAVDDLIAQATRPTSAQILAKVVSSLPEHVFLNEIKIDVESSILELKATIKAESIDSFRQQLRSFAQLLSTRLKLPRAIGLEDLSFQTDDLNPAAGDVSHQVTIKVNLT